jgi:osmotically-inducible protein OsmY
VGPKLLERDGALQLQGLEFLGFLVGADEECTPCFDLRVRFSRSDAGDGCHGVLLLSGDPKIAGKVKAALLFRRNVDASEIEVSVQDGIVTLRGEATSQARKELTTEYAENVDGVQGVNNEMTVSATAKNVYEATMRGKIDDASITAQVRMALLLHRSTSVLNTKVETNDGVVTLRGMARNVAEKDLVSELVSDIKGVKSVKNEMSIEESK